VTVSRVAMSGVWLASLLSPQLIEAILQGRQPVELTTTRLSGLDLPLDWTEQHKPAPQLNSNPPAVLLLCDGPHLPVLPKPVRFLAKVGLHQSPNEKNGPRERFAATWSASQVPLRRKTRTKAATLRPSPPNSRGDGLTGGGRWIRTLGPP
jgi:hypothetical protein